ncbi:1-aminocyclopropane-1-carboxylate deaminase/D-cysteine desulfhydrase [Salmonirosea aquatica]|uniref:Pyridoxal-phosphate dependent enzyme n=1 Tax=Salmonirosea aquatica TaxID=2654236 RepID=A0A7C9FY39_9BACT|nr:pyridoxal-phosphate dependent enzyme [Cytophagaceae bacterium SJW1-29]
MQPLVDLTTQRAGVNLYLKRDDLIHPTVSGNKWRKLKYILLDARQKGYNTLLTFGGARSNHLYAAAAAGALLGMRTIGFVRGEEYLEKSTETLDFCRAEGMQLYGISREKYKQRNTPRYLEELKGTFPTAYIIPEGGTTPFALPGVRELVMETETQLGFKPDYFAVAAGTGGTTAGLLTAKIPVLAFTALKGGGFLKQEILELADSLELENNLHLFTDYHFGGYARHTPELLAFMEEFELRHQILLEHVYTGKMLYGLYDLMNKGYFQKGETLVAIHTGGLQGRSHVF